MTNEIKNEVLVEEQKEIATEQTKEIVEKQTEEDILKESVISYFRTLTIKLTDQQKKEFYMLCKLHNLNPLKREIYAVNYGSGFQVITNYYEYLKRADQTGLLDYYEIKIEKAKDKHGREMPTTGKFIGKRKDGSRELVMEFPFNEGRNDKAPIGTVKPFFMFEKCILANGLRRLFPNELGNMPYVSEELGYGNKYNEDVIKENIKQEEKAKLEMGKVM